MSDIRVIVDRLITLDKCNWLEHALQMFAACLSISTFADTGGEREGENLFSVQ